MQLGHQVGRCTQYCQVEAWQGQADAKIVIHTNPTVNPPPLYFESCKNGGIAIQYCKKVDFFFI